MPTMKENLAARAVALAASAAAAPDRYTGPDWWQLSAAEAEVFNIDRARFPVMCETWTAYERFKNLLDEDFYGPPAVIEAARRDHPEWCGPHISAEEFAAFAMTMGGLTYREAFAIYAKQEFWGVRNGVARYADEVPGGASNLH